MENNVKAFLERQEAEKKAEQKKAAERTKNLLELRKGNKDGSRAANRMLKVWPPAKFLFLVKTNLVIEGVSKMTRGKI